MSLFFAVLVDLAITSSKSRIEDNISFKLLRPTNALFISSERPAYLFFFIVLDATASTSLSDFTNLSVFVCAISICLAISTFVFPSSLKTKSDIFCISASGTVK